MARAFNGTTDRLKFNLGGAGSIAYGTTATILYLTTGTDSTQAIATINNNSGSNFAVSLQMMDFNTGFRLSMFNSSFSTTSTNMTADRWYCCVTRKATGTVAPRHSWYDYTAGTWSHENGGTTQADYTIGSNPLLCFDTENAFDRFAGSVAVRAIWKDSLPWSADTTGDALLVASGLPFDLMAWISAAPTVLHVFDQAATGTNVLDWTGGASTQSSLTGTSLATVSQPEFTYGAPVIIGKTPAAAVANPNAECAEATGTALDATVTVPAEPTMTLMPVTTGLRLN